MSTIPEPSDDQIIKLADEHDLVALGPNGTVWPYHTDADIRSELLAFARALLASVAPPPKRQGESEATLLAIADVDKGKPKARAARDRGIQPSTLFRALKRRREASGQL